MHHTCHPNPSQPGRRERAGAVAAAGECTNDTGGGARHIENERSLSTALLMTHGRTGAKQTTEIATHGLLASGLRYEWR